MACVAASIVGSLIFIDNLTHDGSSWMDSEVYKNFRPANLRRNVSKLIGSKFIMQQDNKAKHTTNTTKDLIREKVEAFRLAKSITRPEPNWAFISPPEGEWQGKAPKTNNWKRLQ